MNDETPEGRELVRQRIVTWFRFRWIQPVLFGGLIIAVLYVGLAGQGRQDQLTQLQASAAVTQAFNQQQALATHQQQVINKQQAALFNVFFIKFIAEQNYLCRIAAARAIADHLEPPPAGVCDVSLTPSPSPSPSAGP